MKNNKDLKTINYNVPGDPSSAAFFISAACLNLVLSLLLKIFFLIKQELVL